MEERFPDESTGVLVTDGRNSYYEFEDPRGENWMTQQHLSLDGRGCVVALRARRERSFCVEEQHLPPRSLSDSPVSLQDESDCAAELEIPAVTPGEPCIGDQICPWLGNELGVYLMYWCHDGRLRYVDSIEPER